MSSKNVADTQSKTLQSRLNAAIESRVLLEEDFKAQSSMLIEFVNKLSQVSKGIDIKLDNRLAQLRGLFTRSAHISDIELKIDEISKLLQKHTLTNEKNIEKLHEQFNNSGQNLQKAKGLPNELRRNLRELLNEAQTTKESITQYAPLFSQLLDFYNAALQSKSGVQNDSVKIEPTTHSNIEATTKSATVNSELIKKISSSLNQLTLSTQHTKELLEINKRLLKDTTHDGVLQHFIEIFDVIAADLQNERNNAKNFLKTLSKTLTTVQHAVKETLSTCEEAQNTNDKINIKLQEQLLDMSGSVKKALSLDQVKVDINGKLNNIAKTLEQKAMLERQNQQILADKLNEMTLKVDDLEEQSRVFETKLAEQQRKSMQDALTKLSNRAAFDEYFTQAMVRFHHQPFDLAIAVIDVDDFKNINDTYGHTAGDKTLQVIANTIQKKVSKGVFVARYGGEEFVLIYIKHKQAEFVEELNLVNTHVARLPFKFKNDKVSITLSIGATHITEQDNIHTAFERADKAMYKAKTQGKNQVIYF
jgi:diguanylate cyclase (GGDEF)-like protein